MNKNDKRLLEIYMFGFDYELKTLRDFEIKAFNLGRAHAIAGDDVSSVDLMGEEEILKEIKK